MVRTWLSDTVQEALSNVLTLHSPRRYRWAFVPEVDTEGPALPAELEEGPQECTPHTVRILELLKLKYGVGVSFSKMSTHGRRGKAKGSMSVRHLILVTWNHFQNSPEY